MKNARLPRATALPISITSVTPLWRQYPCRRLKRAKATIRNKINIGSLPNSRVGYGIRKSKRSSHAMTIEAAVNRKWNDEMAQNRCLTSIEVGLRNSFAIGEAGKTICVVRRCERVNGYGLKGPTSTLLPLLYRLSDW